MLDKANGTKRKFKKKKSKIKKLNIFMKCERDGFLYLVGMFSEQW